MSKSHFEKRNSFEFRLSFRRAGILAAFCLLGCQQGSEPVAPPLLPCDDPSQLKMPGFSITPHKQPKKVAGNPAAIEGMQWARGDSVRSFFGGKDFKLAFTLNRRLYLVTYTAGEPEMSVISEDDEGVGGQPGSINSPLFSPDGARLAFAGTVQGKPGFILNLAPPGVETWRVPLDKSARVTADPHWHREGGRTWIYFATLSGLVTYSKNCGQLPGNTYRLEVLGDTALGPVETTGIRGAYRGGISRDRRWTGTSYSTSTFFDSEKDTTIILAGGEQQCNPSMNPYPAGSRNSDFMLILAFGGVTRYHTVDGDTLREGLHENLWIYNRDNRVVWRAKRPDTAYYWLWDKPEWSTHPDYATAVAIPHDRATDGDLYVVRIGDLADAEVKTLQQPAGYLRIATGKMSRDTFSHLWVQE